MKKIEADQTLPYRLMKNPFMHSKQYKDYLYIINKNINNISPEEAIELLKKLSNTGCSCAALANLLVDSIYTDDLEFKNTFGFSILTRNHIDCNKLMVDIFSKLYKIMKIKFVEYKTYKFKNAREAALLLLGKQCDSDSLAFTELFDNDLMADGIDPDGNLLFKNKRKPKITNYVGNCAGAAKEKFNIDGVDSFEELKDICKSMDVEVESKDAKISQKFTGLGTNNFNYWSNYYISQYNINLELFNSHIVVSDFNNDYDTFMDYLAELMVDGYSVTVSTPPNSEAHMHTKKRLSWQKISTREAGHIMLLKGFNEDKDMVVASYGQDYIIPKEYFNGLEFNKIKKIKKLEKEDVIHKNV